MKRCLITGSSGLVGSEMVRFLCERGWRVYGIDNDMRGKMFGEEGSTKSVGQDLLNKYNNFIALEADIRNPKQISDIFKTSGPFDLIVHAAAQPSHEWSVGNTLEDFQINAYGTVVMLQAYRVLNPEAVFIHCSSSKVYGDSVNNLPLIELETRFDLPEDHKSYEGMDETMSLEGDLHSPFGASKACADIMAREYSTYFDLPIGIFRPVCITGSSHKGVENHGYLAYLVKCVAEGKKYTINGYKGKQVRDNIHAYDLVTAFWEFYQNPKVGKVYNIGAGRKSNNSILEALKQAGEILGKKPVYELSEKARRGDHKWCIYSADRFRKDYPNWEITYDNDKLMEELASIYK